MEQYKFEGDLENVTPAQLEFIKNVIEQEGFKDSKVTLEPVGADGDNYAASVKRVVIEGENGKLSIIAKLAPSHETVRKSLNAPIMFNNEHIMYTEVLPKFLALQKQAEVAEEDLLRFPKCYGTNVEAPNEVVLLEDLKDSGFSMLDRFTPLSDECVRSVLRNLAIFHSLSYVLKSKEPETYDYFKDNLKDMWGAIANGTPEELAYFKLIEDVSLSMLDDPEHQNVVKNKISTAVTMAAKMAKFENGSRYAVIQHGDCWTNNVMFNFEVSDYFSTDIFSLLLQLENSVIVFIMKYLIRNCVTNTSYTCFH